MLRGGGDMFGGVAEIEAILAKPSAKEKQKNSYASEIMEVLNKPTAKEQAKRKKVCL